MWFRRRPATSETISYNPPPDGSYPPRLLAPVGLVWLNTDETIAFHKHLSIRRRGDKAQLIPSGDQSQTALVNGQPLFMPQILRDGDFIQCGRDQFIFQVDPVADHKRRMQDDHESFTLTTGSRLRKHIDLISDGLLLAKSATFIRWDEIAFLEISISWGMLLTIHKLDRSRIKVHLDWLNKQALVEILNWFHLTIPFDLSIVDSQKLVGGLREEFPDAYQAAAYEKILLPAQQQQRELPVDWDVIFGIRSIRRGNRIVYWGCSGIVVLFVALTLVTREHTLIDLIPPVVIPWGGLTLLILVTNLWRYLRRLKSRLAEKSDLPEFLI